MNDNRIVNILVHAPKPYLYESIDTLDEPHTGEYIAKKLSQVYFSFIIASYNFIYLVD